MNFEKFAPRLGDWAEKLRPFIESEECTKIYRRLKEDTAEGRVICPSSLDTFRAFRECPFDQTKVVFMGMDPYPWIKDNIMVADGMAFSCSNTGFLQDSLSKFYEGIEDDLYKGLNLHMEKTPDLTYLARQGVLLLNASLTVEANKVGSHRGLWDPFIRFVIDEVLNPNFSLVYVLCGEVAQTFSRRPLPFENWVIQVEHPAASTHRDNHPWKHNKVFSQINKILQDQKQRPIEWVNF